jgi:uncharacterized protein (TIGR02246 family)
MRIRTLAGILVAAATLALSAPARAEEGIELLDKAWVKAMKAGDAQAVSALYAPDALLWLPGAPEARGAKAIHDAYAGLLAANTVTDAVLSDGQYETLQNVSISWGHFILTLTPKAGGVPVIMGGRFSAVAKRIGGKWLYVTDHASAEPPPAAAKP